MGVKIGNLDISAFKVGSGDCTVYLGSELIYSGGTPPTPTEFKWKATYTGGTTSSAECDSTSAITNNEITKANLASVIIGDCVTTIGSSGFNECGSITSVTMSDNLTTIGNWAFRLCSGLTSVVIPSGVTSIGQNAFAGCYSLTGVTIPNGVTSIGNNTFENCDSLTSIDIPDSVTNIGNEAFVFCTSLTSIAIPNSVTSIGDAAFNSCSSLTSIDIPDSVTSIGDGAFAECSSLTGVTINATIPPSLGEYAFDNTPIANGNACIHVPSESVDTYKAVSGFSAYSNVIVCIDCECSGGGGGGCSCSEKLCGMNDFGDDYTIFNDGTDTLTQMDDIRMNDPVTACIGSGITTIGNDAFSECGSLESVEMPSGVTSIGNMAFQGCIRLETVIVNATTPPTLGRGVFIMTPIDNGNGYIYVPDNSVMDYQMEWYEYENQIRGISQLS